MSPKILFTLNLHYNCMVCTLIKHIDVNILILRFLPGCYFTQPMYASFELFLFSDIKL